MVKVLFEVAGDVQLNRDMLRVGEAAADMSEAFEAVAELWIAETADQFATEGRHASGGWRPLAESTVKAKQRHHLRPEILRAHDRLMPSLTDRGDPNMILTITPGELDYGSKVGYVGYHQKGTRRMPQRRPVEFTEATRVETIKILQRFVMTGEVA